MNRNANGIRSKKRKLESVQTFIPVKNICRGVIETTDSRYIRILEIEPLNFVLRSPEEQHMKKLYITLRNKSNSIAARAKIALDSKRAEMYVDKGVGIIIAVVVGGVLLAGIYSLFNTTIIPKMTTEISNMFNYAG